jgi:hypothetical protein
VQLMMMMMTTLLLLLMIMIMHVTVECNPLLSTVRDFVAGKQINLLYFLFILSAKLFIT